ncbi:MAG: nucleotidyltransferase domain-containing protein [Alphaproteobacteria bacterium]
MASISHTFSLLTRALRVDADGAGNDGLAADLAAPDVDWPRLLRLADREHITASLTASLRRRALFDDLPGDIRAALKRRYFMGAELNARIKTQAEEVVALFNSGGCTPMLLKGGLYLFEAPPEALGGRVLRDLDMVVPADQLEACIGLLRQAGYVPEGEHEDWTYHYRPMHHKNKIVPIELHVRPGEQRTFISVEDAWAEAVPVKAAGLKMVALAPAHRILHNIFHSEIQDAGFVTGAVCLRQLGDLAAICLRFADSIDWRAIDSHMEQHRMGRLFRARLHLAVELLGAPAPDIEIGGLRSRLHLRHVLMNQRLPRLAYLTHWLAGATGPLKRYHLDLLYGCGTSGFSLQAQRIKHIWNLMIRHRGGIMKRLVKQGRSLQ